jgi:hypothetical protein
MVGRLARPAALPIARATRGRAQWRALLASQLGMTEALQDPRYLNDVEISALRHDGWPASNIDTLMFGVDRYGDFPVAEDIWFDDLVVDSQRIGCTR